MEQYEFTHRETGQKVTLNWDKDTPPTRDDVISAFRNDIKNQLAQRSGGKWKPEVYGDTPAWGVENPKLWGARGAGLEVYNKVVQPSVESAGAILGSLASPIAGTALGYGMAKKGGEMVGGFLERAGMPEELHKRKRGVLEEVGRSAFDVGTTAAMGKAFEVGTRVASAVDDQVSAVIRKGIEKGVRPTVVGKRTFPQTEQYYKRAENGVKTIIENKPNLKLTDEFGTPVEGVPKNLRQFSQAIDQTKREIFKQYDALAKQAGKQGAKIDTSPIVRELKSFANLQAIKLSGNKSAAKYAMDLADEFVAAEKFFGQQQNVGAGSVKPIKLSPELAQDTLTHINARLDAFYKNPSYDTASKAYVDSLVANNLRKSLDKTIMGATGKQYQVLKNKYGSLKAIEKEVNHRAVVDARKNPKGLLDFSDVFTGYHAAKGILTMDPATMGAAGAGKSVAWLYRIKNQPNYIIKNMFKNAEKLMAKEGYTGVSTAPVPLGTESPVSESAIKSGVRMSLTRKKN